MQVVAGDGSVEQWDMQVVGDDADSDDSDISDSDSGDSDADDSDSDDSDSDYFTEMTKPETLWVDSFGERWSRMPGTELEMIEEMVTDDEGEVGLANTPEDERLAAALALGATADANPAHHPMCRLCSYDLAVEDARGLGMDLKCKICQKNIDSHECHHCAKCRFVFCSCCQMSAAERRIPSLLAFQWGEIAKDFGAWAGVDLEASWKRLASSKTLVEVAVADGNLQRLMLLMKDDLAPGRWGDSLLHLGLFDMAAENGNLEVVRLLIEKGADVRAEDNYKRTPLHLASEARFCQLEVVRLLIEKGADVSAEDKYKRTPAHLAVENGHSEVIRLLIEKGADVSAEDSYNGLVGSLEGPLGGRSLSDWERGKCPCPHFRKHLGHQGRDADTTAFSSLHGPLGGRSPSDWETGWCCGWKHLQEDTTPFGSWHGPLGGRSPSDWDGVALR